MTSRITSRGYAGPFDLKRMVDLLLSSRPVGQIYCYPSQPDLEQLFAMPDTAQNTRLWEDAQGQLAAFAVLDGSNNLLFEIALQVDGEWLEKEIIAWGLKRLQLNRDLPSFFTTLDSCCRSDDFLRIDLLQRLGFRQESLHSVRLVRALAIQFPEIRLPAGFTIRHLAGEQEVDRYVALVHAAFNSENITVASRLAFIRYPGYIPELDLIAIAPNGDFAAFCLGQIFPRNSTGSRSGESWLDPVGTHPAYRRLGLARALLLSGLSRLSQRGVSEALLGTGSENLAMIRAAKSVGFVEQPATLWFSLPIPD
jgi:mycothiol synthase